MVNHSAPILPNLPDDLTRSYNDRLVARTPFIINNYIRSDEASKAMLVTNFRPPDNFIFMGIPGLHSLSMIAAGPFQNAILFDLNATEIKAAHNILKIVQESETPQEFIDKIAPKIYAWATRQPKPFEKRVPKRQEEDFSYFIVPGIREFPKSEQEVRDYLNDMARDPYSWLQPKHFAHIKDMQEHGRIHTALVDITDPQRVQAIDQFIRKSGFEIGALYTSSIRQILASDRDYFSKQGVSSLETFDKNVQALMADAGSKTYDKLYIDTFSDSRIFIENTQQLAIEALPTPRHYISPMVYTPDEYRNKMQLRDKERGIRMPHRDFRAGNYIFSCDVFPRISSQDRDVIGMSLNSVLHDNTRVYNGNFDSNELQKVEYRLNKLLEKQLDRKSPYKVMHHKEANGEESIGILLDPGCKLKGGKPINLTALMNDVVKQMQDTLAPTQQRN